MCKVSDNIDASLVAPTRSAPRRKPFIARVFREDFLEEKETSTVERKQGSPVYSRVRNVQDMLRDSE